MSSAVDSLHGSAHAHSILFLLLDSTVQSRAVRAMEVG